MTETFGIVVVVVAVVGTALSFSRYLWPFDVANELGKTGAWFSHEEDLPLEQRHDGNQNDALIPRPRLRGRS
jgi:hypothetical protein